ncbi:F0F1 ATP synthase subunit alpha [Candidatus Azambacteria bacterium]|nr:F0F1 ATP synthase subunit alpha [Candidatus Azambacteria bacterium]
MISDVIIKKLKEEIAGFKEETKMEKVGTVLEVGDGVAKIAGLFNIAASEMLTFETKEGKKIPGTALNLEEDHVGAIILGSYHEIQEGDVVKATGKILSVPVSDGYVGRTVNALLEPVDGKGKIAKGAEYPVEKIAPGVITRTSVSVPLHTGIKAIDAMIPIGRGQRELIIGDRKTGKTAVALDAILNQKGQNVVCIYVAIGQRQSRIRHIVSELSERGAMDYTTVVTAGASDPAAMVYIAPYAATALGEYFMDQGKDVLVVYDDLSKHAQAYRQISLLLRRPPGREAYPGDIFYLHSRLLERACRRDEKYGGGSLTALPIIETQASDVSAYIPTNVISITDGQIYLETDLFYQGIRPALNIGLSVSRVGGAAQLKITKKVAGKMRLDLAQYRELAAFAQFAADLDENTKKQLERGKRVVEIFKQDQYQPVHFTLQAVIFYAVTNGYCDAVPVQSVRAWEKGLIQYVAASHADLIKEIEEKKELTKEIEEKIKNALETYVFNA